jgi:hypothetical protein
VIEANGGTPPLTYAHFCHVTMGVGPPPRPCPSVDLATLEFASLPEDLQAAFFGFGLRVIPDPVPDSTPI